MFNQLSLTLHGALLVRVHLLSCWLASARVSSSSESQNPHGVALRRVTALSLYLAHSLILSLTCSFIHVNVDHRIVALPFPFSMSEQMPVTFYALRSVIAARRGAPYYIAANCRPLLPDLVRRYVKPSNVWDRQASERSREETRVSTT